MTDDAPSPPGEFDRRAAAWVRKRFPGANPHLGSVEFSTDCAAYQSGGWAKVAVSWVEQEPAHAPEWCRPSEYRELIDDAWEADLTGIIRELLETEVPDDER